VAVAVAGFFMRTVLLVSYGELVGYHIQPTEIPTIAPQAS